MNLTNFLKQTDTLAAQYSAAQLTAFIHDIGRTLPEHYREDFLERLRAAGAKTEKVSNKNKSIYIAFEEQYGLIRNNLKKIDAQEVALESILNEEYDDWYDNDSEEFYYEDNSGISDMLADACEFVHTCMDTEKYKEGFEVGNQLFSMAILCESEYGDEKFSIGDVAYHELLNCDLKQVILDTAYCAYHAVPLGERPEALYGVIANAHEDAITLEAIMQHGDEELPDLEDFLTLWISYLGDKTEHEADCLIAEGVGLLNDVSLALQYAEKYAAIHPGLYLKILESGKYVANDMVSTGMRAMELIPKKYTARSRAALKTAEYVLEAGGDALLLEKCYFAAYESDTSALNYLRAFLNGYGTGRKREELQKVLGKLSIDKNDYFYGMYEGSSSYCERDENKQSGNTVLLLRFLDGQFAGVLDKGLNKSEALGWSGTFMKQGIALYLLYLYEDLNENPDEGQWNDKGIAAMEGLVKEAMRFSAEEYRKGTCGLEKLGENTLFRRLFLKWKSMVRMEDGVRERAVKKIEALLEVRTEGIMNANRRNYYGECAAYIAALGEVWESLGETGAKQRFMTMYKDRYSRRSAFREEMRRFGWIDVRRK